MEPALLLLDLSCREPRRVAEVLGFVYILSGLQPGLIVDQ